LLNRAFEEWNANNVPTLGAALAYYSVFAIAPLLIIVIAAAALLFGDQAAHRNIVGAIEGDVGRPVAKAVEQMLANNNDAGQSTIATLIGLAILLFGAAGVFAQLQEALNAIWKVAPKPRGAIRGFLWSRFVSFTMVLGCGFLLLVSLIIHAGISALSTRLSQALPGGAGLWQAVNVIVSFGVVAFLFALIFKYVPDAQVAWKDVWVGAALTSALFGIGKFLLGWYLGQASTTSAYGAAASLVVILLWVYYAAQILLFGAAFTRVYAIWLGSRIKPSRDAISTELPPPPRQITRVEPQPTSQRDS
jgi:membrane protein